MRVCELGLKECHLPVKQGGGRESCEQARPRSSVAAGGRSSGRSTGLWRWQRPAFRWHHGCSAKQKKRVFWHHYCSRHPLFLTFFLFLSPFADGCQAAGGSGAVGGDDRGRRRPGRGRGRGQIRGRPSPWVGSAAGKDGRGWGRPAHNLHGMGMGMGMGTRTGATAARTRTGTGMAGSLGRFRRGRRPPWVTTAVGDDCGGRQWPGAGRAGDGGGRVCGREWPWPGMRTASAGGRVLGRPKAGERCG